jgi:hypothetical protein
MRLGILTAIALLATAFSGCLEFVENNSSGESSSSAVKRSASPRTVQPIAKGTMTADETVEPATATMCGGISLPPQQTYCATKVIRLAGTMEGIKELGVTFDTFVGDIDVSTAPGNDWAVTATLRAQGTSEQAAIANLENILFSWSHESKDGFRLLVEAEKKDQNTQNGESASYQAVLPKEVVYFLTCDNAVGDMLVRNITGSQVFLDSASGDLTAEGVSTKWFFGDTASGDIELSMLEADELFADTASGDVRVSGKVGLARIDTASGDVVADIEGASASVDTASGSVSVKFRPMKSGSLVLQATSGDVELAVPEGPAYGYSLAASTTSGSVEVQLKDGRVTGADEDEKKFLTSDYSRREKRVEVDLRSTSGDVSAAPLA